MFAQTVAMLAQSVAMLAQSVAMLAQSVAMLAQSMGKPPSVPHFLLRIVYGQGGHALKCVLRAMCDVLQPRAQG